MSRFEFLYHCKTNTKSAHSQACYSHYERLVLASSVVLWVWTLASAAELTELTPAWLVEHIHLLLAT